MSMRTGHLALFIIACAYSVFGYPDCRELPQDDGYLSKSKMLKMIGLIYPLSFELNLGAFKECYYVSNSYLKLSYQNSDAIQGTLYQYGFDGWDGSNPNTCSLLRKTPLDRDDHSTAISSVPFGKNLDVCSYVVRVRNTSPTTQSIIFVTMSSV